MRVRALVKQLESSLTQSPAAGSFAADEVANLPEPVQRYFAGAIAPGSPLMLSARIRMRGRIKIGRWVPFRARELLTPRRGFVWAARAGGVIAGFDSYARGQGEMDWKLVGAVRVAPSRQSPLVAGCGAVNGA